MFDKGNKNNCQHANTQQRTNHNQITLAENIAQIMSPAGQAHQSMVLDHKFLLVHDYASAFQAASSSRTYCRLSSFS